MSRVQSLLLSRRAFSFPAATRWVLGHRFSVDKVAVSDEYFRFRQRIPSSNYRYRTIYMRPGVKAIVAFPKASYYDDRVRRKYSYDDDGDDNYYVLKNWLKGSESSLH